LLPVDHTLELSEDQRALRTMLREFAEAEIAPFAAEWDRTSTFPATTIRKLGELGVMGLPFPEAYGGVGAGTLPFAIALEELARVDSSVAITVAARDLLAAKGVKARVMSMPSTTVFDRQDAAWRDSVLPPLERARLERAPLRLLDSKDERVVALNVAAPQITDRLCDACAGHFAAAAARGGHDLLAPRRKQVFDIVHALKERPRQTRVGGGTLLAPALDEPFHRLRAFGQDVLDLPATRGQLGDFGAMCLERSFEALQAFADRECDLTAGIRHEHDELFTADSSRPVACANVIRNPKSDELQTAIAGLVPEFVVDRLRAPDVPSASPPALRFGDPLSDDDFALERLDMDVAGALLEGVVEDVLDGRLLVGQLDLPDLHLLIVLDAQLAARVPVEVDVKPGAGLCGLGDGCSHKARGRDRSHEPPVAELPDPRQTDVK